MYQYQKTSLEVAILPAPTYLFLCLFIGHIRITETTIPYNEMIYISIYSVIEDFKGKND